MSELPIMKSSLRYPGGKNRAVKIITHHLQSISKLVRRDER